MEAFEAWVSGLDPAGLQFVQSVFTVGIFLTLWMHPWTWSKGDDQ
jgi:hypothetical protein